MRYYSEAADTSSHRQKRTAFCHLMSRLKIVELLRFVGHVEFIPMGLRIWIINQVYRAEYSPSQPFEVDFFSLKYRGNLNCFVDWYVYFFGAHEKESLFLLRDLISQKRDAVFID